jgi:hypothetical protein
LADLFFFFFPFKKVKTLSLCLKQHTSRPHDPAPCTTCAACRLDHARGSMRIRRYVSIVACLLTGLLLQRACRCLLTPALFQIHHGSRRRQAQCLSRLGMLVRTYPSFNLKKPCPLFVSDRQSVSDRNQPFVCRLRCCCTLHISAQYQYILF